MLITMKTLAEHTRETLSFYLGYDVDIVALPTDEATTKAFDEVIALCKKFQATIPNSFSVSGDEVAEAWQREGKNSCCRPPDISKEQFIIMQDIQEAYRRFVKLFNAQGK